MQTLSKGFGLAAIRCAATGLHMPAETLIVCDRLGIALAHPALIQILMNTKAPYNISTPTASLALAALSPEAVAAMRRKIATLVESRGWLLQALASLPPGDLGPAIGGNDANFVLVPVLEKGGSGRPDSVRAQRTAKALAEEEGIVLRFRGHEPGCEGCLRITVGSSEENKMVVARLREVLRRT